MYSNKRRSHVHFIKQFDTLSGKYTGTRVVIYIKGGPKLVSDYDNFIIHKYENSKTKIHSISRWEKKESTDEKVIKKEMINYSLDRKYKMIHTIYETINLDLEGLIDMAFKEENIKITDSLNKSILELSPIKR